MKTKTLNRLVGVYALVSDTQVLILAEATDQYGNRILPSGHLTWLNTVREKESNFYEEIKQFSEDQKIRGRTPGELREIVGCVRNKLFTKHLYECL